MSLLALEPVLRLSMVMPEAADKFTTLRPHSHLFYELGMVVAGACYWKLGGKRRIRLEAGDFILVSPGTEHLEESAGDNFVQLSWGGFTFADKKAHSLIPPSLCNRRIPAGLWAAEMASLLQLIYDEHGSQLVGAELNTTLSLRRLLILLLRSVSKKKPVVRENLYGLNRRQYLISQSIAHYLRHNFQSPLTISEVARYHSLSAAHLSVIFRKHYGNSPGHYLTALRILHAKKLLEETEQPLKVIAAECGYGDVANFCRRFRAETGLTPGEYAHKKRR